MSSIQRALSGDPLVLRLAEERAQVGDPVILERTGRSARTLVKAGPLRVTLVVVAPGGNLAEHHAPGPITVQVLEGGIRFSAGEQVHELEAGDLLSLASPIVHSVSSEEGGAFLLTVVHPEG